MFGSISSKLHIRCSPDPAMSTVNGAPDSIWCAIHVFLSRCVLNGAGGCSIAIPVVRRAVNPLANGSVRHGVATM